MRACFMQPRHIPMQTIGLGQPACMEMGPDALHNRWVCVCACMQLPVEQRRGVPHHLIDIRDPLEEYSAGEFHDEGRAAARAIAQVGALGCARVCSCGAVLGVMLVTCGQDER